MLSERRAGAVQDGGLIEKADGAQARKDRKRSEAEQRQREQPLRKKIKDLDPKCRGAEIKGGRKNLLGKESRKLVQNAAKKAKKAVGEIRG